MTHDFDAAIKALNQHDTARHATILADDVQATIQFALKFTKAALSGGIREAVIDAADSAYTRKLNDMCSPTPTEEHGIGAIGYAILAANRELAKEVGNG